MTATSESGDSRVLGSKSTTSGNSGSSVPFVGVMMNPRQRQVRGRLDHCPIESKHFLPFQYQTMLYEIAKSKNTIICMSTGSGKTFIAIMLLKEMSHQIRSDEPFDPDSQSGPKRSIFLVPTRPLVQQHAKSIEDQSDLMVAKFTGDDRPDDWDREEWISRFAGCHVAVMTAEIFARVLSHSFVPMHKFNLIVFDECHWAMHNHPYNCVMSHYDSCPDPRPRILGLTASLITRKVKPEKIRNDIHTLSQNLRSDIETSCDVKSVNKYATNPIEEVRQYSCRMHFQPEVRLVIDDIIAVISDLQKFLSNVKIEPTDQSAMDHSVRPLVSILTSIEELGIWGAKEVSVLFAKELAERIVLNRSPSAFMTTLTHASLTAINYGTRKMQQILQKESPLDQMLKYSSEKMLLLLQTLVSFRPSAPEEQENRRSFCGIVFVQKRSDARVISHWLNQLVAVAPDVYGFLSVNYVTGQSSSLSGISASSQRQEDVLSKFRKHEYNLLIATSVLEEGLDITRCNLVIRFDIPKTVREYVQSKGRCRAESGHFVLLCPTDPGLKERVEQELREFREIESILKSYSRDHQTYDEDGEEAAATDVTPPDTTTKITNQYSYKTSAGAIVSLNSSISIVNRYCLKLPSDSFTKLTPREKTRKVDGGYVCELRLPINCPLRQTIRSEVMSTKIAAKKCAAFHACVKLYELKELDEHFLPVGKDNLKFTLESLGFEPYGNEFDGIVKENKDAARPGTTKRRQYYSKLTADVFKGREPAVGTKCLLYVFAMRLTCRIPEEQNTRGRKIVDPSETRRSFGILVPSHLPGICDFPVFTRSGEVMVSLEKMRQEVVLSAEQIQKISHFHQYTFHEVLHVDKYPMKFDVSKSESNFYLVPVIFNCDFVSGCWTNRDPSQDDALIDWDFMTQVREFDARGEYIPSEEERKNFVFREEVFRDAVIKPWYRQNKVQFFYYVAEICKDQSPRSSFPDLEYPSFADYYESKYKIKVMSDDQPLLDVDHTSARLNLLTPRYVNRKGITLPMSTAKTKKEKRENSQLKQILIPELVIVHPFPASFWRKTVTLPCILYRLNSLFLAEQLRLRIAREIHLGLTNYPPDFKWPPLDFGWTLTEVLEQQQREEEEAVVQKKESISKTQKRTPVVKQVDVASVVSSNGLSEDSQEIPVKDDPDSDFLIDTFDPEKYVVHDDIDLDDEFNEADMRQIDAMLGFGGPPTGSPGIFDIGPPPQSAPIGTWDKKREKAKIIELDDTYDGDTNSGMQDLPRVGSPSNFEREEESNRNAWDQFEDAGQFRDIGLERGLAKISVTGDINIESLCEDLVKGPTFDDAYDSDDSIFDDEDEEFSEAPAKSADRNSNSNDPKRGSKLTGAKSQRPEPVNEILFNSLIDATPPGTPGICDEYLISRSDDDQSVVTRELCSLIRDYKSPDDEDEKSKKSIFKDETDSTLEPDGPSHAETNFGELLPKHQRDEMQSLDGLGLRFDVYKSECGSGELGPSPAMILQALTMSNASDGINLERMETVGDSFLKYAVTLFLYCKCEKIHEGKLSYLRSRQISNFNLYRLGRRKGLGEYIIASKFEPNDNWLPPGYYIPDGLEGALIDLGSPSLSYDLGELRDINLHDLTADQVKTEVMKRKERFLPSAAPAASSYTKFSDVDNEHQQQQSLLHVPYNLLTQQSIPDKSIADCVEALIGAYLLNSGAKGALLFMKWLGLKVMPDEEDPDINSDANDPIWHHLPKVRSPLESYDPNDPEYDELVTHQQTQLNHLYSGSGLDRFEREILQYEFRDKSYLVQAFTHNSYFENTITDCYQRLEFLGDAILDFLVTRLLYEDPRKHSPGTLTDLRSALVNNTFFASLAVEYEFHKYMKNLSHDLYRVKSDFVTKFNAKAYRDHCSLYIGEEETENLGDVEVPKALGDIFESVAGAIFLDSGMSLDAVWRVYYRMMKPEIEHFSKNVPKSPIRELLEMEPQNAQFGKPELIPGKKVRVCVEIFGEGSFCGVGRNKRIAKCTAAKRALRVIRPKRKLPPS